MEIIQIEREGSEIGQLARRKLFKFCCEEGSKIVAFDKEEIIQVWPGIRVGQIVEVGMEETIPVWLCHNLASSCAMGPFSIKSEIFCRIFSIQWFAQIPYSVRLTRETIRFNRKL